MNSEESTFFVKKQSRVTVRWQNLPKNNHSQTIWNSVYVLSGDNLPTTNTNENKRQHFRMPAEILQHWPWYEKASLPGGYQLAISCGLHCSSRSLLASQLPANFLCTKYKRRCHCKTRALISVDAASHAQSGASDAFRPLTITTTTITRTTITARWFAEAIPLSTVRPKIYIHVSPSSGILPHCASCRSFDIQWNLGPVHTGWGSR